MSQVKFYRGDINTSLPNKYENGAVYVIQKDSNSADIYTDLDNNTRVKIGGNCDVIIKTTSEWAAVGTSLVSERNTFYIYSDGGTYINPDSNSQEITYIPRIKIGDGNSYVVDLPFISVLPQQVEFWNNKLNLNLTGEILEFNRL